MKTPNFDLLKIDETYLAGVRRGLEGQGIKNAFITFLGRQRVGGVILAAHLPYITIKESNWNRFQSTDFLKFVLLQGFIYRIVEIKCHENMPARINQAVAIIDENASSYYQMIGSTDITNANLLKARRLLSIHYHSNNIAIMVSTNLRR